ncbi:MAG: alpha/beta hydrolase [Candidatus Sumerlaeaceae bacterium]|nr:alpha/beta hydrolase [Candidatus Sumerlaeaceae bacterium]
MLTAIVRIVGVVAICVGVYALLLFFFQRRLIYYPRSYEVAPEALLRQHLAEGKARILSFEIGGMRQYAYYIGSLDPPTTKSLCVIVGGNATLALDLLDYGEVLLSCAHGVLLVDYPGYGQSEGQPSRTAISLTVRKAFEELALVLGRAPDALAPSSALMGISLGCAAVLELAQHYSFKTIVLLAPFTSLMEMARKVVGWPLCYLLRDRFDNRLALSRILSQNPLPELFVFHGDADNVVPVTMSQQLAREFPSLVRYNEIPGADHVTIIDLAFPLVREILCGGNRGHQPGAHPKPE